MRLDVLLVQQGYFSSRELAKENIIHGNVLVNGLIAKKPSMIVSEDALITLEKENTIPYVSRGGLKLEKALKEFNIDCKGLTALDLGASTGGFTDCLLKHGVSIVYAVDVGHSQLSQKLKDDHRIISIENTHVKDLTTCMLNNLLFDIVVMDLSFISLTKVIGFLPKFLNEKGVVVALIKPQFEVGPAHIGKGGLVKNPKQHIVAIENVFSSAKEFGLFATNLTYTLTNEVRKNIEYLALFEQVSKFSLKTNNIVDEAFRLNSR